MSLCCSTLTPTWIRYLQNSVVFIFINSAVLECFYSFFEKGNSLQCDAITIMLNENICALLSNLYKHERVARRVCDFRLGWYGRVLCFSKIYTCLVRSFTQFQQKGLITSKNKKPMFYGLQVSRSVNIREVPCFLNKIRWSVVTTVQCWRGKRIERIIRLSWL